MAQLAPVAGIKPQNPFRNHDVRGNVVKKTQ